MQEPDVGDKYSQAIECGGIGNTNHIDITTNPRSVGLLMCAGPKLHEKCGGVTTKN